MRKTIVLMCLLAGCSQSSKEKGDQPQPAQHSEHAEEASHKSLDRPRDTIAAWRLWLQAQHSRDLPKEEDVRNNSEVADILEKLATSDRRLLVRKRAARLLWQVATPKGDEFAARVLADSTNHPSVRAQALSALAMLPIERQLPYRAIVADMAAKNSPRFSKLAKQTLRDLSDRTPDSQ